jgi:hypothetical protein
MNRSDRWSRVSPESLLALAGALGIAISASGCDHHCGLSAELATRAGSGAIACGHVALGADRTATDACVVAAFTGGKAFHASYDVQGTDSHVSTGVVSNAAGQVTFLLYDGNVGGGGGDGAPVISATACDSPALRAELETRPEGTPPLSCAGTRDLGDVCL